MHGPQENIIGAALLGVAAAISWFGLRTTDGREYTAQLTPTVFAELVRNLATGAGTVGLFAWAWPRRAELLAGD